MKQKQNNKNGKIGFIVLFSISLVVMLTAIVMIFFYTRQFKPDVVHANDQTTAVEEHAGYVNERSMQQLEHDAPKIMVKPLENSQAFIIGGAIFMVVIMGSYLFVKLKDRREEN